MHNKKKCWSALVKKTGLGQRLQLPQTDCTSCQYKKPIDFFFSARIHLPYMVIAHPFRAWLSDASYNTFPSEEISYSALIQSQARAGSPM